MTDFEPAVARFVRWMFPRSATWFITVMFIGSGAAAESSQAVALEYSAPLECPARHTILTRTLALVQHEPRVPLTASATITRDANGYRLELRLEGGKRVIVSQSCESLVKTLTLVLALAVDPKARRAPESPGVQNDSQGDTHENGEPRVATPAIPGNPASPATVVPVDAPGATIRRRNAPMRARSNSVPWEAKTKISSNENGGVLLADSAPSEGLDEDYELHPALLLITEYGMLPQLAHGPSLGFWVDRGNWSLSMTAFWLVPTWAQMPGTDQWRGGHISFLGGGLELCRAFAAARLVRACAGVEVGDMMGKGSGVSNSQIGHGVWLAPVGSVGIRPKFWPKMGADVRLSFAVPMKRPAFGFDGFTWRFEPHAWSIRLASGFCWF